MNVLGNELARRYEQVFYDEFYRDIFQQDLMHNELDEEGAFTSGEYIGIATRISTFSKNGKQYTKSHNFYIYEDLGVLDELVYNDKKMLEGEIRRLTIVSPISYAGSRRTSENSRFLYALCIEIDGLRVEDGEQVGLRDLLHQIKNERLPRPTYIVASGSGLHLYYKFEKPIPCFKNVKRTLWNYKKQLTKKLWNSFVTTLYEKDKIQFESVFQGFRMVGTQTKKGDVCECYRVGEAVSIEYMNQWASQKNQIAIAYKSNTTKAQAKNKWPEWYERRIVQGDKSKGHWNCNKALYEWWKNEIFNKTVVGHRYYNLMLLSVYAIKCNVDFEELENDAFSYLQKFEQMTNDEKNHFTEEDVEAALDIYRTRGDNLYTYPLTYIEKHSGIEIPRNKRNGRKQATHLKIARSTLEILNEDKGAALQGRKSKQAIVQQWKANHPQGTKAQCIKDTGLSKPTVYKHWEAIILDLEK